MFLDSRKKPQSQHECFSTRDSDSSSSTLSTTAITGYVDMLKRNRNRSSTRKTYYGIWRQFNEFFIKLDEKPETWEDRLVLFIGFLIGKNLKSKSVRSYISAIRSVLEEDGITLSENKFLITSLTKACRYENNSVCTQLSIHKRLLELILARCEVILHDQPYLQTMYKALFSIAYYGLFRIGELTSGNHPVKVCDVHICNKKCKLLFVLRTSKTHWTDSKPQFIKIMANGNITHQRFCPFFLTQQYIQVGPRGKSRSEPFFIFSDRSPLLPEATRKILHKCILQLNLDPRLYVFHGICAGRSCDLLAAGIDIPTIARLGHWKSNTVYTYLNKFR